MAKILAVIMVLVLVYGCTSSQLSRSRIDGYDTRPTATVSAERPARSEATARILQAERDLRRLSVEARCKSDRSRLTAGVCR